MMDLYRRLERQPENLAALDAADEALVARRFAKMLTFGTAGLRGPMGFGLAAMNSVTVLLASQGLCQYYLNKLDATDATGTGTGTGSTTAHPRYVCIGFDGRHNSQYFAHITAAVFLSKGFSVSMATVPTATPMCPFAVQRLKAVCGVQVTASHNPKEDNGYKVYASNGAQIVPPMDKEIHELILAQTDVWPGVEDLMRHELRRLNPSHPKMAHVIDHLHFDLWPAYKSTIGRSLQLANMPRTDLKIVYTAMHGVGWPFVSDMLRSVGFPMEKLFAVPTQRDPDPDFSTVAFPNPEEKGALDAALRYADEVGADLVIANDPDADRFACCERDPASGRFVQFTGDELGAILGCICFETAAEVPAEKKAFICSAVSSGFLARMCAVEGSHFCDTLTGFKYIMNKAFDLRAQGLAPVFGYEEALGYAVSLAVPDKDGVSAAALWVKKAAQLHAQGQTMAEYLHELCVKYGFFATRNSYYRCPDPAVIPEILDAFRTANNGTYPDQIGQYKITRIRDVGHGYDSGCEDNVCQFKSKETMITIYFENGAHVTFRGSGTEPKLKYYSEMSHNQSREAAQIELNKVVDACQTFIIGDRPLVHA